MQLRTNRKPSKLSAALSGVVLIVAGIAPAVASGPAHAERRCARQFEAAQRMDMESFRDYDADTFRAIHTEDAITVFAGGQTFIGIDAIMNALRSHFQNREAIWEWTERYRTVDGCRTAYILYETKYSIPSIGFAQRALTGVSYTYQRGAWLGVADQGTLLPPE
jgi:ketosteroid isomerase-like protein